MSHSYKLAERSESACRRQIYDAALLSSHEVDAEEAALRMLPANSFIKACERVEEVFEAVKNGTARNGVVPVEDDIGGSVYRTYDLMLEHDVTIVAESVHQTTHHCTRFVMISKPMEMARPQRANYKRSLVFRIPNEPGALFRALKPFAARGVNIARIESRPVKGSQFEYLFYLDLVGRTDHEEMHKAIEELRKQAIWLKVLGLYAQAGA